MLKRKAIKLLAAILAICLVFTALAGCRQADRVSYNVSKEADNFNVVRKITVFNARTDTIMFEMIGTMSIANSSNSELAVICKVGPDQ